MSSQTGTPISDSAEIDRFRQRPGAEHTLLVENTVVRKVVFESRRHSAPVDEDRGVVHAAVFSPGGRRDERGPLWLSRIRQSIAAWHASTTDGRRTRSSGGISDDASSGSTTRSAPSAAQPHPRAPRMRARLPSMSPTVGLSCASAMVRCTGGNNEPTCQPIIESRHEDRSADLSSFPASGVWRSCPRRLPR